MTVARTPMIARMNDVHDPRWRVPREERVR